MLEKVVERPGDGNDVGRCGHSDDQKDGFGHRVAIIIAEFVIQVVLRNQCKHGVQGIVGLSSAEKPVDAQEWVVVDWQEYHFEDVIAEVAIVAFVGDTIDDRCDLLGGVFAGHAVEGVCENGQIWLILGFSTRFLQTHINIVCDVLDVHRCHDVFGCFFHDRVSIFVAVQII